MATRRGGGGAMARSANAKYLLAVRAISRRSSAAARSRRAAVTLARMAARIDRKNGNAASASKSSCVSAVGQIPVEDDICRLLQSALQEVHQQKCQIVEDVAGSDNVAELDGIEQNRLAFEQHDIAEMKVAVNAASEAIAASLAQQRRDLLIGGAGFAGERVDVVARKYARMLPERVGMFVDIIAERFDPCAAVERLRLAVRGGNDAAQCVGK